MNSYLGRIVPGPGSSGPGTKTKRLLLVQNEKILKWTVHRGNLLCDFIQTDPLRMLGWAQITSARAFKDSMKLKKKYYSVFLPFNANLKSIINVLPLRDLICPFPYGADEKLPQKMKQVGGMEA